MLCMLVAGPAEDRLVRDYFGMHRFEWPDEIDVEFHLTHGRRQKTRKRRQAVEHQHRASLGHSQRDQPM